MLFLKLLIVIVVSLVDVVVISALVAQFKLYLLCWFFSHWLFASWLPLNIYADIRLFDLRDPECFCFCCGCFVVRTPTRMELFLEIYLHTSLSFSRAIRIHSFGRQGKLVVFLLSWSLRIWLTHRQTWSWDCEMIWKICFFLVVFNFGRSWQYLGF